jgi:Xaa-Pro aminopeptidase
MTQVDSSSDAIAALGPDPRMPVLPRTAEFAELMSRGWSQPDRRVRVAPGAAAAAAMHRERLSALYPGRVMVVTTGSSPVRSNDTNFDFRPDSAFVWLTSCSAEFAVLVMTPRAGGHDALLYLPSPRYAGDRGFYADPMHGELWVGAAPGFTEWSDALQLTARSLEELAGALAALGSAALWSGAPDDRIDVALAAGRSAELTRTLSELRMVKDDWEIDQLRSAASLTVEGFRALARELPAALDGRGERWLQGTFDRHARTYGNSVGYATIVGSGSHAPTLHWTRNDGAVRPGDLVLVDAGVEVRTWYTADITRTMPSTGRYTPQQRQVYDLIEKAQRAAYAQLSPGQLFGDFQYAAMEVLVTGLRDWGILTVSVDEALSANGQQHRRYCVCGNGHHIGLDVHDCALVGRESYLGTPLAAGMVLAVEPGLYFHANDLTVPPELRGIGVRIEDNVLITARGMEVLSGELPLSADGMESWVAAQQTS